jgi:MFS family permease
MINLDNIELLNNWPDDKVSLYLGIVTSMIPLGAMFGSLFSQQISDYFGRRNCFFLLDVITIFGN